MSVDLHCHTNVSDCSMSINQVIELARGKGVTHLAVTDHDTTEGLKTAMRIGSHLGVEIISGIEISAYDFKRKVRAHVLGYYVQPEHKAIRELCSPLIARRHAASRKMVEILAAKGYEITWEQVTRYAGTTGVFKQHIMHALMEAGYCDSIYGDLYKTLFSRGEQGQPRGIAYIPLEYVDVVSAIRAIRAAGGVPVLAHPGQFDNFEAVPEWVEAGLEGIEVRHPYHDEQAEERAIKLAREFNLIITGGSDFHGVYGDHPYTPGSKSPGLESVYALKERKTRIQQIVV